ncbi:MAG: GNAT family N-acetyltransferase [Planctomycetota bacterium]|nr:GNAT family N-acetyltransferase [Planctomycetota bacterium]MDA1252137.1 GNAT family N-acetyltransferase [Planctomycetota bacterium]
MIQTARLNLRPWRVTDVEPLVEICSDPAVMRFVGDGVVWSRSRCQEFIEQNQRSLGDIGFCQWAVEVRETSELIGFCGFVPRGGDVEIGWRIGTLFQQQGYGLEAARAVVDSGSEVAKRIFATIQTQNLPSKRLAERLGMRPVEFFLRDGREVQVYQLELPSP